MIRPAKLATSIMNVGLASDMVEGAVALQVVMMRPRISARCATTAFRLGRGLMHSIWSMQNDPSQKLADRSSLLWTESCCDSAAKIGPFLGNLVATNSGICTLTPRSGCRHVALKTHHVMNGDYHNYLLNAVQFDPNKCHIFENRSRQDLRIKHFG